MTQSQWYTLKKKSGFRCILSLPCIVNLYGTYTSAYRDKRGNVDFGSTYSRIKIMVLHARMRYGLISDHILLRHTLSRGCVDSNSSLCHLEIKINGLYVICRADAAFVCSTSDCRKRRTDVCFPPHTLLAPSVRKQQTKLLLVYTDVHQNS